MRIPFCPNQEDTIPLKRCLEYAAAESGIEAEQVVLVMSAFLEQLAAEVAKGRVVRIPGFGIFGTKLDHRVRVKYSNGGRPVIRPCFVPSNPFNQEVRASAPVNLESYRARRMHQKKHAGVAAEKPRSARVFTAQKAVREQIRAQML